jgi:predicted  nucleic acid-binding Zn-ribbon protein
MELRELKEQAKLARRTVVSLERELADAREDLTQLEGEVAEAERQAKPPKESLL